MGEFEVTSRMPDDVRLRTLMVSYQSGDISAFDQLYALVAPVVRGFLRRQLPDGDRLNDLVQDTFLQIHRARRTYNSAYPLVPWVLAIARHVWLMHRRAASRRPHAREDVSRLPLRIRAEAEAYPDKADLHAVLRTLPADRRKPLVWHHVWGLSFREIAGRLGIRTDAAKLRSSRGMAELRHRLGSVKSRVWDDDD